MAFGVALLCCAKPNVRVKASGIQAEIIGVEDQRSPGCDALSGAVVSLVGDLGHEVLPPRFS